MGFDGIDKMKMLDIFNSLALWGTSVPTEKVAEKILDGRKTEELISIFNLFAFDDGDKNSLSESEFMRAISSAEFLEIVTENKNRPYERGKLPKDEFILKRMECERNLGNPRRKW